MNKLPKCFVIKRDESDPLWWEYIEWLNEIGRKYPLFRGYAGSVATYYGIDDNYRGTGNGTFFGEHLDNFQNNPKLITLKQWKQAMSDELKITKDKVRAAAEQCEDVERVMKTLFPEAFEDDGKIEPFELSRSTCNPIFIANFIAPEGLEEKCFGLNSIYDWDFIKNGDNHILIPRKK